MMECIEDRITHLEKEVEKLKESNLAELEFKTGVAVRFREIGERLQKTQNLLDDLVETLHSSVEKCRKDREKVSNSQK